MLTTTITNLASTVGLNGKDLGYIISFVFWFGGTLAVLKTGIKSLKKDLSEFKTDIKEDIHEIKTEISEKITKHDVRITKNSDNQVKHIVDFHSEKK